jgi:hypothetical protein
LFTVYFFENSFSQLNAKMKMKWNSNRRIGLTHLVFGAVIVNSFVASLGNRLEPPARIILSSSQLDGPV